MILVKVFIPLIIIGALLLVGKWGWKNWKKADIEQKIDDIELKQELAEEVSKVDKKSVEKARKSIDDFDKLSI